MSIKKEQWENSYSKGQNFIFYPKEETVKFLNRYIKKRKSSTEFLQLLNPNNELRGLDFGCGIGRMTILLHEFGIEGYGIDISKIAISEAKKLASYFDYNLDSYLSTYNGETIPFSNDYFDFTISEAVFDSLSFVLAKPLVHEIDRVTKKYFYLSLISSDSVGLFSQLENDSSFNGEIEVLEEHENGTIQSLFDQTKIDNLFFDTKFKIKRCEIHSIKNTLNGNLDKRWYLVMEK